MPSPEQGNSASGDKHPEGRPSNSLIRDKEALLDTVALEVESAVRKMAKDFPDLAVANSREVIERKLQEFTRYADPIIETILKDPSWDSQQQEVLVQRISRACESLKKNKATVPSDESSPNKSMSPSESWIEKLAEKISMPLNASLGEFEEQFDRLIDEAASTGEIMHLVRQEPTNIFNFISATALRIVHAKSACSALFVGPVDIVAALQSDNPEQVIELSRGYAWWRESPIPQSVSEFLKYAGTYHSRQKRDVTFADDLQNYVYDMKPDCIAYLANKRLTLIPAHYGGTLVGAVMLLTDESFRFNNHNKARLLLLGYESAEAMAHIARINSR